MQKRINRGSQTSAQVQCSDCVVFKTGSFALSTSPLVCPIASIVGAWSGSPGCNAISLGFGVSCHGFHLTAAGGLAKNCHILLKVGDVYTIVW